MTGPQALATALRVWLVAAADARWFAVGVVTAYSSGRVTATIDGATVAGIGVVAPWIPAVGQVALFGVLRTGASVSYFGLGDIDTVGLPAMTIPSDSLFPSPTLYPSGG